jgi:hypothetical protein
MVGLKVASLFVDLDSSIVIIAVVMGPLILSVIVLPWWVFLSRATVKEKVVGTLGMIASGLLVHFLIDPSMRGPGQILIGIPLGMFAFGVAAVLVRNVLSMKRTIVALLACVVGFGSIATLRNDGMWGNGQLGLDWRWSQTPEEQMLLSRKANSETNASPIDAIKSDALSDPQWPQFRGPESRGIYSGPEVFVSDWAVEPPKLQWKIKVGPGWSSFAVAGNLLFTQEQLGDQEAVVCYAADSGKELWSQKINERFFDPLGGPGPRATPTLAAGMLFAQSAMGELQRLDPKTGDLIWSQDLKKVADREPPYWGFSSSPIVMDGIVIAFAGGEENKGLFGFSADTGELAWNAKAGDQSYSSPQEATVDGVRCVLMATNEGVHVVAPDTGEMLLAYEWLHKEYRVAQPQTLEGDSVLLATQELGTRRIKLEATDDGKFQAREQWTTPRFRPDFNDFVVHQGHAYGFDGSIFQSVDLSNGERNWRGGRYGKGQVLLLEKSELLLVATEDGRMVLLKAKPTSREEVSEFEALEGRTWNHPVVVGDRLYVRNSQEAACYVLPTVE